MKISNVEMYNMLAVYFECNQNSTIASRVYAVRYPGQRRYNKRTFARLARRLRENGNVNLPVYRRQANGRTEENTVNILAYILIYPHMGIRQISLDLGIKRSTVHNILKDHRFVEKFNISFREINIITY